MNRATFVGTAFLTLVGCATVEEDPRAAPAIASASASAPHHPLIDAPGMLSFTASPAPPPAGGTWLASTDGGASIALAAPTGAVIAKASLPPGEVARDLVADPLQGRALLFAFDEDDAYGELMSIAVGPASLGPATHLAWIDGAARFATDGGVLLAFEESYGDAWKRLDSAGESLPRWPAPPPLARAVTTAGLDVLFDDSGGLSLAHVARGEAWPPDLDALGASGTAPASARLAMSESGERLFDAVDGQLAVRRTDVVAEPSALGVEIAGGRLEQAIGFAGGRRLAALISGRDLLVTLRLDESGDARDVGVTAIGAPIATGDVWPVEALAVIGPAELGVATSSGVIAFREAGGALACDRAFDGRSFVAPIASWP